MNEYEFALSLRIRHPSVDPTTISDRLKMQPQHSWRAGEQRRDDVGVSSGTGQYRESYWMRELMPEPKLATQTAGVESELVEILSSLQGSCELFQWLHSSGGVSQLHVSVFARGSVTIELPVRVAAMLGRVGLTLAIDVEQGSVRLQEAMES
jgi:hypothetical protein